MKQSNIAIADKSSQSYSDCEAWEEYKWTGEYSTHPKLVDSDGRECKDLSAIAKHYESSKNCKKSSAECDASEEIIEMHRKEIIYCQKRFKYLVQKKFAIGCKVILILNNLSGIIKGHQQSNGLVQAHVGFETEEDKTVSFLELTKVEEQDKTQEARILKFCTGKPEIKMIAVKDIRRNGGTQQRVSLNHETVKEYAAAMRDGNVFPAVKLKYDGKDYWLTDGFHTTDAAWSIGKKELQAEVTQGTQREAILDSVGVNSNHGLRRTNSDKRKAVTTLLEDEEWRLWSDREIAQRCKVHHGTVAKIRKELTGDLSSDNPRNYKDKHGNISQMSTGNIGKVNCDKQSTQRINERTFNRSNTNGNKELAKKFEVGQMVEVELAHFHGASEELKLANHSYGVISGVTKNETSFYVAVLNFGNLILSPQDIKPVKIVTFPVTFTPTEFKALMSIYSTNDQIETAIKQGVLGR